MDPGSSDGTPNATVAATPTGTYGSSIPGWATAEGAVATMITVASARMPGMRRTALTVLIALAWLVALSQPAAAHSVSGVGAANWKTVITAVSPPVAGLRVRVVENGSRLEVTNRGPEIVVLGYEGEAYLRVGPQGVFENEFSPASYLNCSRAGCSVPAQADPSKAPQWKRISTGQTVLWHDHRIHYMGGEPPPEVAQAPDRVRVVGHWTINMIQGTTPFAVTGNYSWIPGPSPIGWLVVAAVFMVAALALGRSGMWGRPLAAAVAALTINDVYHGAGIAWFWSGDVTTKLAKLFSGSFYSMIGWVLGLVAVWLLWRRRIDGLYAAVFAGISAALFTGLLDIAVLSRSQAPFQGPTAIDRLTVAVSLGLGVGVALGALAAIRRTPRAGYEADDEDFDGYDEDGEYQPQLEVS